MPITQKFPRYALSIVLSCFLAFSCADDKEKVRTDIKASELTLVETPQFNADTAYQFIEKQLSFGPRVPNTEAHQACGQFLMAQLEEYGAKVISQNFEKKAYDGTVLNGNNIIASFNEAAKKRILLCAHWDTRHIADKDSDYRPEQEVPQLLGANDGASGVAVLLELARLLSRKDTVLQNLGVDIILFDLEDYGSPETGEGYCLGSQHWSKNKHKENYSAYYGILLDMIAGKGSVFVYEDISYKYGRTILKNIWSIANAMGYSELFLKKRVSERIIDDHYFLNVEAKIPTIDIIGYSPVNDNFFHESWHTRQDNMEVIDKGLLKKVGQVLIQTLYQESQ